MFETFIVESVILINQYKSCLYTANSVDLQLNQLFPKLYLHLLTTLHEYIGKQWAHLPLIQCLETEFSSKYINIIEIDGIYITFTDWDSFQFLCTDLVLV